MNPDDQNCLVTVVMPYGKYKDRLIADLPGRYLNWFAREGFPSGELGRLLAPTQEMDPTDWRRCLIPYASEMVDY